MRKYVCLILVLLLLTSGCAQSKPAETPAELPPSETEQQVSLPQEDSSEEMTSPDSAGETEVGILTLPALPENTTVQEIGDSPLPMLTLPEDGAIAVPSLTAWQYMAAPPDATALKEQAKDAASRLWETYTITDTGAVSEIEDTADGPYQESIQITADGELWYQAKFLDSEETPFLSAEKESREEAVTAARSLAETLGLRGLLAEEPVVTEDAESAHYVVFWPQVVDGLPVYHHGLKARILGNTVVTFQATSLQLEQRETAAPDFFLTPEDALYCVNYARSLADGDSVLLDDSGLSSVELCLDSQFAYPDYSPVYLFHFPAANGDPNAGLTVRVDAYTGNVDTGTNQGGFPSPYGQ